MSNANAFRVSSKLILDSAPTAPPKAKLPSVGDRRLLLTVCPAHNHIHISRARQTQLYTAPRPRPPERLQSYIRRSCQRVPPVPAGCLARAVCAAVSRLGARSCPSPLALPAYKLQICDRTIAPRLLHQTALTAQGETSTAPPPVPAICVARGGGGGASAPPASAPPARLPSRCDTANPAVGGPARPTPHTHSLPPCQCSHVPPCYRSIRRGHPHTGIRTPHGAAVGLRLSAGSGLLPGCVSLVPLYAIPRPYRCLPPSPVRRLSAPTSPRRTLGRRRAVHLQTPMRTPHHAPEELPQMRRKSCRMRRHTTRRHPVRRGAHAVHRHRHETTRPHSGGDRNLTPRDRTQAAAIATSRHETALRRRQSPPRPRPAPPLRSPRVPPSPTWGRPS